MTKLAKTLMKTLTRITAFALLALSGVYFLRMNSASRLGLFLPKILAGSLAPFIVLAGAVSGLLAFLLRMPATGAMAGLATLLAGRYTWRASAAHEGFDRAFGPGWEQKIPPDVAAPLAVAVPPARLARSSLQPGCGLLDRARSCGCAAPTAV